MNKKQNYKWKERQKEPPKMRKIRLEIFDDGIYVGTINTDITLKEGESIVEETLVNYVKEKMPTYKKKKHWTLRVV